jgi:hypothetical protein
MSKMRRMSRYWAGFATILAWLSATLVAEAACTITGLQSMAGATANLGRYSALTAPVAQVMTINLVLRVTSTGGTCSGNAALIRTAIPAVMTGAGGGTLRYDIQTLGGTNLINQSQTIPFSVSTASGQATASISFQVQAIAQAGQVVAAGGYSDTGVQAAIYDNSSASTPVALTPGMFVNAAVNPSCTIDGGAVAQDAAGVQVPVSSSGVVTTAPIQRDYARVSCNAPSDMTMSSQNSGIVNPAAAPGGFTNVIHYTAQAAFGGAAATLNTATSAMTTGSIDATTGANGTMTVTVSPQQPAGATLINGRYIDVLSVTLTPR